MMHESERAGVIISTQHGTFLCSFSPPHLLTSSPQSAPHHPASLRCGGSTDKPGITPDHDPTAYVQTLLAALDDPGTQRDTEQIPIAEAILLLAGPTRWSEHA